MLTQDTRAPDTGSPLFDFDSLVSTPEHPSLPLTAELTAESSSVGSQDRPFPVRTTSSHDQQYAEGNFVFGTGTYNTSTLGRSGDVVLEDREDMDQVLLSKFRTELMPQHPFVVIPQHTPAAVMRAHHPLLMMSIRAIAGFEGLAEMQAQMQLATGHMADRIFRHCERTLDLLMGIVVILGWYHYHCARHNQLNNLLCLAESLVSDLGLNKRPHGGDDEADEERAVEEKRLLLGVWYLRSSYVHYQHFAIYLPQCPSTDNEHSAAMHLPQPTSMPFTSYMRQCLTELEQAEDHDLDQVLV